MMKKKINNRTKETLSRILAGIAIALCSGCLSSGGKQATAFNFQQPEILTPTFQAWRVPVLIDLDTVDARSFASNLYIAPAPSTIINYFPISVFNDSPENFYAIFNRNESSSYQSYLTYPSYFEGDQWQTSGTGFIQMDAPNSATIQPMTAVDSLGNTTTVALAQSAFVHNFTAAGHLTNVSTCIAVNVPLTGLTVGDYIWDNSNLGATMPAGTMIVGLPGACDVGSIEMNWNPTLSPAPVDDSLTFTIPSGLINTTGNLSTSSTPTCITSLGSTAGVAANDYIADIANPTNIPAGTQVLGIGTGPCSAGQIQMNASATGNATGDALIFSSPNVPAPTTTGNFTNASNCLTITSTGSLASVAVGDYVIDETYTTTLTPWTTVAALPGTCGTGNIQLSADAIGTAAGDTLVFMPPVSTNSGVLTTVGEITASSNCIKPKGDVSALVPGQYVQDNVTHQNIPAGTTIASVGGTTCGANSIVLNIPTGSLTDASADSITFGQNFRPIATRHLAGSSSWSGYYDLSLSAVTSGANTHMTSTAITNDSSDNTYISWCQGDKMYYNEFFYASNSWRFQPSFSPLSSEWDQNAGCFVYGASSDTIGMQGGGSDLGFDINGNGLGVFASGASLPVVTYVRWANGNWVTGSKSTLSGAVGIFPRLFVESNGTAHLFYYNIASHLSYVRGSTTGGFTATPKLLDATETSVDYYGDQSDFLRPILATNGDNAVAGYIQPVGGIKRLWLSVFDSTTDTFPNPAIPVDTAPADDPLGTGITWADVAINASGQIAIAYSTSTGHVYANIYSNGEWNGTVQLDTLSHTLIAGYNSDTFPRPSVSIDSQGDAVVTFSMPDSTLPGNPRRSVQVSYR